MRDETVEDLAGKEAMLRVARNAAEYALREVRWRLMELEKVALLQGKKERADAFEEATDIVREAAMARGCDL